MPDKLTRVRRPWDLGTWLWLLNRIAGTVCILFLLMHICVISTSRLGKTAFDSIMAGMHSPMMLLLEFVLIMAVVAHGLNGLRHIAIDFGFVSPEKHSYLFRIAVIVASAILAVGAIWMLV